MVLGATTASPACTVRIAPSRSGGAASLSRNAAAPALIAAKAYSSRSNVVSTITAGASGRAWSSPGGLDAVEPRHPHVHQHDVAGGDREPLERLGAVARLADHRQVGLAVDEHPEPGAHHLLVVDQEDPDRTGSSGDPRGHPEAAAGAGSGLEVAVVDGDPLAHAEQAEAVAVVGGRGAAAVVLDGDVYGVVDPRPRRVRGRPGPACLRTLVSASWTTR